MNHRGSPPAANVVPRITLSNVVPLSTFPKAEVMAWLQALHSWEAANGIIGDLDDRSCVIAAPAISTPAPIAKSTPTRSALTQSVLMQSAPMQSAPMQSALMQSAPIRLTPAQPAPTSETQPASPPPQ